MIWFLLYGFILFIIFLFIATAWGEGDLTLLFQERFGKPLDALRGQVVWITGASSGIGEALAYVMAENQAKLVLSGRDKKALENVKKNCIEMSKGLKDEDILVIPFDIGDYSIHEACFKEVLDHFGDLDILVNNAGRSQRASFQDIDIKVHEELFRTNTFGPVMLTKTILPHFLKKQSGHFVVTSSSAGILGAPYSASYTGSKHALHGFFECLRVEVAHSSIDITMVCPGPVASKIVHNATTGKPGVGFEYSPELATKRRCVATSRCAKLMACAIVNKVDQAWISNQPVMLFHYLNQYMPSLFRGTLLKKLISQKTLMKLRDG